MSVRLSGSTSGYAEIDAPAVAGNNTLILPGGNGTNGQFLQTNGSGALSWSGSLTLGTAQNSTSGTSIDFTGIPSWVKRVTVMFNGVSTNGVNSLQVQLGSGSIQTTGYVSSANSAVSSTSGLLVTANAVAANNYQGLMTISLLSSNAWVSSCVTSRNDASTFWAAGAVTLSGTLDRIRVTSFGGTDTFDAGSINILYEG